MKNSTNALLTSNAVKILEKRYLDKGSNETVDGLWDRVSGGNEEFRQLMAELKFLPNSPALFNMGLNNGCTSSACFVFDVEDSMLGKGSIVETREKAIAVAKAGGGVGYYLGKLRPKGSPIKSIHRVACGPVTVLKDYHAISQLITQGGKRELAQIAVLDCDHQDIQEFIHVKDSDPQGLGSFNISVGWKDPWVKRAKEGWEDGGDCYAQNLWNEQCESAWKTGCPGMWFPDTVNEANPNLHLGRIYAPNPCGETPNRSDEPCSLGSLSLPRFFLPYDRSVDWDELYRAAYTATLFMDDILTRNTFPHLDIHAAAMLTRKLGLGVMGWADLLAMMHIHYDTQEAIDLAHKVMKLISEAANKASLAIAEKYGPYPGFCDTKTRGPRRRNESISSIAPTGTISLIAGVWGSIEPHFALGELFDDNLQRTTSEGMRLSDGVSQWVFENLDGFVPKTAREIAPEWHVRHQAAFQAHTDLGVSKTVNLPNSATVQDVSSIYRMMHDLKCKGGTVFRDGCRQEAVLVRQDSTKSVYSLDPKVTEKMVTQTTPQPTAPSTDQASTLSSPVPPSRKKLPAERPGVIHKFTVGGTEFFLTVGLYPGTQEVGEIFINGNFGSTIAGLLDTFCITFSIALQNGTSLQTLVEHHQGKRFEPAGITDDPELPICSSVPDYVVRWLEKRFLGERPKEGPIKLNRSGMLCPNCGKEAIYNSGCLMCVERNNCGWTRCG